MVQEKKLYLQKSVTPQTITVYFQIPVKGQYPIMGSVSADFMGAYWWINRAIINPESARGKGYGSQMLKALIEEVKKQPCQKIVVAPGGYENKTKQQFNYYKKNGFRDGANSSCLIFP